jgi:predicted aspartyl protease
VRFSFREIPDAGRATVRARPIVDLVVEGLDIAPQACLLDTGATAIRLGAHVAELCGIDTTKSLETKLAVGGALVTARMAIVSLQVTSQQDTHRWNAPVWFCDPWTPAFGLLGLTGFFDQFHVTIAACDEWFTLATASN